MAVYAIAAVVRFKRGRQGNVLQYFELVIMTGKDSEAVRKAAVERFYELFAKTELSRTGWYILRAPQVIHLDQARAIEIVKWASKPEPLVQLPAASPSEAPDPHAPSSRSHLRVVKE